MLVSVKEALKSSWSLAAQMGFPWFGRAWWSGTELQSGRGRSAGTYAG